jgi:hypothetical protein
MQRDAGRLGVKCHEDEKDEPEEKDWADIIWDQIFG